MWSVLRRRLQVIDSVDGREELLIGMDIMGPEQWGLNFEQKAVTTPACDGAAMPLFFPEDLQKLSLED